MDPEEIPVRHSRSVRRLALVTAIPLALACSASNPPVPATSVPDRAPAQPASPTPASTKAPAAPAQVAPRVTDLMPAFWSFWERAQGTERMERVRLFKDLAIAPHREFYEKVPQIPSDDRLDEILKTLAPAIPALRRIDREFSEQLPRGFASFLAAYPGMDATLPIYVGPSLFTSSGQSRDLNGRTIVFYGLDVLAVVLPDVENHLPDIHHEMFHAYHWQRNPEIAAAGKQAFEKTRTAPMYYDLWSEGLALLAVRRLDADAPLSLVLSSKVLPEEGPKVLARVAGELRARLDVTDLDDVGDYFFFKPKRADLPSRIAYYVGLRLTEEVGRNRSMDNLVTLGGKELRQTIESGLRTLEGSAAQEDRPDASANTPGH